MNEDVNFVLKMVIFQLAILVFGSVVVKSLQVLSRYNCGWAFQYMTLEVMSPFGWFSLFDAPKRMEMDRCLSVLKSDNLALPH